MSMTRILFLPDDRTILQFDSAEPAEDLASAVNAGRWLPPEPYRSGFGLDRRENRLRASRQGSLVVVMLSAGGAEPAGGPLNAEGRPLLSKRTLEVLHGLAEGLTTRQIAARLGVTPRMVQYHVSEIKRRLGARSRAQSVSRAQALGMVRRKK